MYKIEIKYINIKQFYLYKMSIYEKNLSEPWFSLIKLKIKTVEGRLNKGDFANMNIGDFILFTKIYFTFCPGLCMKTLSGRCNFR
jgi:hypothetical protein